MTRTAYNYPLLDPKKARRATKQTRIVSLASKMRRFAQEKGAEAQDFERQLQKERQRSWWSVTKERMGVTVKALFRNR